MKIRSDHYQVMRDAIAAIPPADIARLKQGIAADPRVKDPAKRLRWDLSYLARLSIFLGTEVYPYADDSHIDTALRQIMRDLNLE